MTTKSPKAAKAAATRAKNLARQHEKEQAAAAEKSAIRAALLRAIQDETLSPADTIKGALMLLKIDGIA